MHPLNVVRAALMRFQREDPILSNPTQLIASH